MKIKSISIYSLEGERRDIFLHTDGLNIITGRSSTGKSALSDIVEYCMGQSKFKVPEGVIREKVSWFSVIYIFSSDEVLVAKPAPKVTNSSNSTAMLRRGKNLIPLEFSELTVNSDDDTVNQTLTSLLGISENKTKVASNQSRDSFKANIKHTYYYLFQKQSIITNKDQLFYRQNEDHQPQAIKDTLPILLGISSDDRYAIEAQLRNVKRELKIVLKHLKDARSFVDSAYGKGLALISEAKSVGVLESSNSIEDIDSVLSFLRRALNWKPEVIPEENKDLIGDLEKTLKELREQRQTVRRKITRTQKYIQHSKKYSNEAGEQASRLESINALPKSPETGEWQWPFAPDNLQMETPIALALLQELQALQGELEMVVGDRPKLDSLLLEEETELEMLSQKIRETELQLSSAITANESIKLLESRNNAASRVIGRISYFLEGFKPNEEIKELELREKQLKRKIDSLERQLGTDDAEDRLLSVLNNLSNLLTEYVKAFGAEFSEFPFRFDLKNLTVVADRPERPIPMSRTGGGENHLAYHISMLIALHRYAQKNGRPIPGFLFLDQPTQVYFPSEDVYKAADGTFEKTESDADMNAVRQLFQILYDFTRKTVPGFQIIVTEHANLNESWFQQSLVESTWSKPPALVPEDWPDRS